MYVLTYILGVAVSYACEVDKGQMIVMSRRGCAGFISIAAANQAAAGECSRRIYI